LAARRSLPVPTVEEISAFDDTLTLSEAWARWHRGHTPPRGVIKTAPAAVRRPAAKRAFSLVMKGAAVAASALLGFVVGERWLPRANAQPNTAGVQQVWLPVTDSVVDALDAKLSRSMTNDPPGRLALSAADMATLIFRSPSGRPAPVDSIEARIDSLLWIRGRLRGASRFELGGDLRMLRRGLGELHVAHLTIDGVEADSARVARLVVGVRSPAGASDGIRFEMPAFVTRLTFVYGAADGDIGGRP
jgi:hypothetical protein